MIANSYVEAGREWDESYPANLIVIDQWRPYKFVGAATGEAKLSDSTLSDLLAVWSDSLPQWSSQNVGVWHGTTQSMRGIIDRMDLTGVLRCFR